jgi:eukaryotic-like serine/threonine-protein kinase
VRKDNGVLSVLPRGAVRASIHVRFGLIVLAVAYSGYLALLVTCDLLRVGSLGFVPRFDSWSVTVASVQPGSAAESGGLRPGDRIVRANRQIIEGRTDWERVRVHLDPSAPLNIEFDRAGERSTVSLLLPSGLAEWRSGAPRPGLLAFRLAQVITLGLALLVAFRRSFQASALLGALLLAAIATASLVLPMRMVDFWHALPSPLGVFLWVPFSTSVAVGPLLFAFFAVFPRRKASVVRLSVALVPAALVVGWHLYAWYHITRDPGPPTGLPDWNASIFAVNVVYAMVAVMLLLAHHRAAETLTEQRRISVLMVGTIVGVAAGASVVGGYWRNPGVDIFATRTLTVLALIFLALPASFAYAILRHRLFDLRLIVRQGVRYALARRFVAALTPALGAVVVIDILRHRSQPLVAILQSQWWWFTAIGGALFVVHKRREHWLRSIDRRFFRDRYDAQRLLSNIAGQISRAATIDAIAPSMLLQISEALHPEFVDVVRHAPGGSEFVPIAATSAPEATSQSLPASLSVIGVLSVLGKPLALSLGDTAWVRHQLPLDERALLLARGIELLVPISSHVAGDPPRALLLLGPRRSEEPYNQEDLDLLVTIADALGLLLERSSRDQDALAECDSCGRCFDCRTHVCPYDDQPLIPVRGSRLLNGRYRIERRLGRGGMGAVYAAIDDVLERPVAVKLIREDGAGPLDRDARFRNEARAAAGFAHPNVVRVYDFGVDRDRRPFLVMELLEGDTLRQRLTPGAPLGAADALHILRGVCSALKAAHGQGLVHRDLKPENIFLQRHGNGIVPKVLDFGLAKAFGPELPAQQSTRVGASAGLLVGTLEYMAPEQVAGDVVNPGWDVWALSVIAYEMLTGRHPFKRAVAFGGEEPMTNGAAGTGDSRLSEAAAGFFRTALSPDRTLRPSEPLDFLDRCEEVLV